MPHRVIVSTGARLHFGLLAHSPQAQRQFGGIGLMIERPGFELSAEAQSIPEMKDVYHGPEVWKDRVLEVVRRCREILPASWPGCGWTLSATIAPHVGLGSGTQLALAVAQAYLSLTGKTDRDAAELGRLAGRGLRSALGIHGFLQGGLIVEVGKRSRDQISPAASRVEWPTEWTLLLVRPTNVTGLCGAAEIAAFSQLPPMATALSARLCQITLLELLPSVMEGDFATCSAALFEFGRLVGEYFSPAQGGTYSTDSIRELVQSVRARGFPGVGQTSWGPTGFVLCPNQAAAESLRSDLQSQRWSDCEISITTARNRGATVEIFP